METIRVDGRTYAAVNIPEFQCVSVVGDEEKNVIFKLMANNVTEE